MIFKKTPVDKKYDAAGDDEDGPAAAVRGSDGALPQADSGGARRDLPRRAASDRGVVEGRFAVPGDRPGDRALLL